MIGKIVKIIIMIQAIIGLIAGIILLFSPALLGNELLNIQGIMVIGLFIVIFEGFILYGESKLHEK